MWGNSGKVDKSEKTFANDYSATYRFNFGGKSTQGTRIIQFETSGAATVKVWWVSGDVERSIAIWKGDGTDAVDSAMPSEKGELLISTFKLNDAGKYSVAAPDGTNYIFKVSVTEGGGAEKEPRAEWDTVDIPSITKAEQSGSKINVTVDAVVGYDGADKVTVTMAGPDGSEVSRNSIAEKNGHSFEFTPSASGTYTFSVVATRDDEETEHKGDEEKTVAFTLPLATPNVKSATNNGGGSVTVEWEQVAEATGYKVTVDGTDKSAETESDTCSATFDGLTDGQTYTFKVVAIRGDEQSEPGSLDFEVKDRVDRPWTFVSYGPSASTSKNKVVEGNANDGSVRLEATDNGGKIQNTVDGLGFYYTVIDPKTTNFTLTATAKINS